MSFLAKFLYDQFFVTPKYPAESYSGQTIIVTGSNVGLGFEAARHIARLGAEKTILAVRSLEKGAAAKESIVSSTGCAESAVEVWQLDLSSYESVKQFAQRAQGLKRLDAIVENAGIATSDFKLAEDNESTVTVNVVSTFLLALLILPKLQETATKFNKVPHLIIVSSEVHFFTPFPEHKSENIFKTLNDKNSARMSDRYNVSKLLEVFTVREMAPRMSSSGKPKVILSCLNPGLCHSELTRDVNGVRGAFISFMKLVVGRTTEVGSRTLVASVDAGGESHGEYMSNGVVAGVAPLVTGSEGPTIQKQVWAELSQKLEKIQPGVTNNL
ncbi:MAG: hypothetical protein M4579_004257 [Chaenotheca gracillima]|nr:MAG: hypothetical protein M4579_004257 [Chaenotheca gracillima]